MCFQGHRREAAQWFCTYVYVLSMWPYALWGLLGAAVNRGVVFLEASQRVKGWPWARPNGPGGGVYAVSIVLHLGIAAVTAAALSSTAIVTSPFIAFGVGVGAPAVVKKIAGYALSLVPSQGTDHQPANERGDSGGA